MKRRLTHRISVLQRFRKRAQRYGIDPNKVTHPPMLSDSRKDRAEAALDYYLEGGRVANVLNLASGEDLEIEDPSDLADAIILSLSDAGMYANLVDVVLDLDEKHILVLLDDRVGDKIEYAMNVVGKYGEPKLVLTPDQNQAVGCYAIRLDIPDDLYRKARPKIRLPNGEVIDTAKESLTLDKTTKFVFEDDRNKSISTRIEEYTGQTPRPYIDRRGSVSMAVDTDINLQPFFEENELEYYSFPTDPSDWILEACPRCARALILTEEPADDVVCALCGTSTRPAAEGWQLAESRRSGATAAAYRLPPTLPAVQALRDRLLALSDPQERQEALHRALASTSTQIDPAYLASLLGPLVAPPAPPLAEREEKTDEPDEQKGNEAREKTQDTETEEETQAEAIEESQDEEPKTWVSISTQERVTATRAPGEDYIPVPSGMAACLIESTAKTDTLRKYLSERGITVEEHGGHRVAILPERKIAKLNDILHKRFAGRIQTQLC